jgi:hypothetical protein
MNIKTKFNVGDTVWFWGERDTIKRCATCGADVSHKYRHCFVRGKVREIIVCVYAVNHRLTYFIDSPTGFLRNSEQNEKNLFATRQEAVKLSKRE